MTYLEKLNPGIDDPKGARLNFDNSVSLHKTDKNNHKNGISLTTELNLICSSEIAQIEGFSLTLYNKAFIMTTSINEDQLIHMLEYVQAKKNKVYHYASKDFIQETIQNA